MTGYAPFVKALPVWSAGDETRMHTVLGLHTVLPAGNNMVLRVATSGFYRVFLNGEFFAHGPARCAHGYYRVDELSIVSDEKEVHLAIEVINHYVSSFGVLRQPGFVQAEISADGEILAATGGEGFSCRYLTERVRRIQRYSVQRPMAESYRLCPDVYDWRMGIWGSNTASAELRAVESKCLVPRNLKPYHYPVTNAEKRVAKGRLISGVKPETYRKDRSLVKVTDGPDSVYEGFPEDQLEQHLSDEVQELRSIELTALDEPYEGSGLAAGDFETLALPGEKTGFLGMDITCQTAGTLYILFDEILMENDVDPLRMQCCNVIRLDMEEGEYPFRSMEAFGIKYLKLVCVSGAVTVRNVTMRELICPQPVITRYMGQDGQLERIHDAALESFLQNSADLFMDCPTRERAGWLCDSYFTAKAERYFTGDNAVERNFLENYILPERFPNIPEGMVPMCYPSDHRLGHGFIPNWAMFLVLELQDYLIRTGDRSLIDRFRTRVYGIVKWFTQYENQDGLLEKLPGWVFVEWSRANKLVKDINYPSNMLYAAMLDTAAQLYGDPALAQKAASLRDLIRRRSFVGDFFCDNEVYRDGVPQLSGECTETCQYYAFFTGTATRELYPELWRTLVEEFGPDRMEKGLHPRIHKANAFIGNFLRLMLLSQQGLHRQVLEEIKGYFLYMADRTGTLWEHDQETASCNHGFASYVACMIADAEKNMKNGN